MTTSKKISDKDRIDWMQRQNGNKQKGFYWLDCTPREFIAYENEKSYPGKTVKQAIDRAIKAERK